MIDSTLVPLLLSHPYTVILFPLFILIALVRYFMNIACILLVTKESNSQLSLTDNKIVQIILLFLHYHSCYNRDVLISFTTASVFPSYQIFKAVHLLHVFFVYFYVDLFVSYLNYYALIFSTYLYINLANFIHISFGAGLVETFTFS